MTTRPDRVDVLVEQMLHNHPRLFENRTQALFHLLCVSGNGYEWRDGELMPIFDEPARTDDEVQWKSDYLDELPDCGLVAEMRAQRASDNARALQIRRQARELAKVHGPVDPAGYPFNLPVSVPGDAAPEWHAAATELTQRLQATMRCSGR